MNYMEGYCHVYALALFDAMGGPEWRIRARIGWDEEDAEDEEDYRVDHVYVVAPDGSAYDCRGRFPTEDDLLASHDPPGETELLDYPEWAIRLDVKRGKLKPFDKADELTARTLLAQLNPKRTT